MEKYLKLQEKVHFNKCLLWHLLPRFPQLYSSLKASLWSFFFLPLVALWSFYGWLPVCFVSHHGTQSSRWFHNITLSYRWQQTCCNTPTRQRRRRGLQASKLYVTMMDLKWVKKAGQMFHEQGNYLKDTHNVFGE